MDPMQMMTEEAPAKAKPRRKKSKGRKAASRPAGVDPKTHTVQVHVNVVNTAQGDTKSKKENEADSALKHLRGF